MAFQITYKRMASIDLLHGYYLNKDGQDFFALSGQDQQARLSKVLDRNRYALMDQLSIEPDASTKALLAAHDMILKKTPTGIFLAVSVETVNVNNKTRYKPMRAFNLDESMKFIVKTTGYSFSTITNTRLKPVFPACYYVTNRDITAGKRYPSLSVPVADFQQGYRYSMGETARINKTAKRARLDTTENNIGWMDAPDQFSLGEYDRILLPSIFNYTVEAPAITEAKFELKRQNNVLKTITLKDENGLKQVKLDFSRQDDKTVIDPGMYTLLITGSNNYQLQHTVLLNDQMYHPDAFAVIELAFNTPDAAFSLTDSNWLLTDQYAGRSIYPQFVVRIPGRLTYWKFYFRKNPEDINPDPTWVDGGTPPFGFEKVIRSRAPINLTQDYRELKYGNLFLPNAGDTGLSRETDKLCSDILIN